MGSRPLMRQPNGGHLGQVGEQEQGKELLEGVGQWDIIGVPFLAIGSQHSRVASKASHRLENHDPPQLLLREADVPRWAPSVAGVPVARQTALERA